jgi:hypothetical protein
MRNLILRVASVSVTALVLVTTILVAGILRAQGLEAGGLVIGTLAGFMFSCVLAAVFLAILQLAENSTKLLELLKANQHGFVEVSRSAGANPATTQDSNAAS